MQDTDKRIGILGGTFDPVHWMHLEIAKCAREQFGLKEVWLMPSGDPPHKDKHRILPGKDRLKMLELAVTGMPGLFASSYEMERTGTIYTSETLHSLWERYFGVSWFFVLGEDSLLYLERWHNPEEILRRATILAAVRGNETEREEKQRLLLEKKEQLLRQFPYARIEFIYLMASPLSSSLIREKLRQMWERCQDKEEAAACYPQFRLFLPEDVFYYIVRKGLYRT